MVISNRLLYTIGLISLMLVGCSGKNILPQGGMTMVEIYDEHNRQATWKRADIESARARISRPLSSGDSDLEGYTREASTEIEQLFPQLPNPVLTMYVFPHMAGDGNYPVPGYSTAFNMYEKDLYALPGEVGNK